VRIHTCVLPQAVLRIEDSDYSEPFSVDIVGSSGRIECTRPDNAGVYNVAVHIQMTNSGLTKLCTFTPYYLVENKARVSIQVADYVPSVAVGLIAATTPASRWVDVPAHSVSGRVYTLVRSYKCAVSWLLAIGPYG
jgi:hypothetical protein